MRLRLRFLWLLLSSFWKKPLGLLEQDDAWCEIEAELGQFEKGGQFEGPCEMLVAVGSKYSFDG